MERPAVESPRSAQRSAGTSNLAFSKLLLRVVGRWMLPKGISKVALSLVCASGKAALRRMWVSCQSTVFEMRTTSLEASREMSWVKCDLSQVRVMWMVLRSGPLSVMAMESRSVMGTGWSSVP